MDSEESTEVPQTDLVGMAQDFNRKDRILGLAIIVFGVLCCIGGFLCFRHASGSYQTTGIPLMVIGVLIIGYGNLVRQRAQRALIQFISTSDVNRTLTNYLGELDQFIVMVRRTRDAGAIVLAVAIAGLLIACIVEFMKPSLSAWLVIAGAGGLMSIVSYAHLFRLELHAHDVQRKL
jgi:hypothetical protein